MRKSEVLPVLVLAGICATAPAQIKRTSVPLGDAVSKALDKSLLTGKDARPFHIFVKVSEPDNPQSPYQGTIEEWWLSPDQWRREVMAKGGMRQTIVVLAGKKTEKDEGEYFPLWLRNFITAFFDPIPSASMWKTSGMTIDQITLPNGDKSQACARGQSKIGTGERATDAFFNVCFDEKSRLGFYGSPRYSMEFHDYRDFGKKQVASKLISDPEPGMRLVGEVTLLEDESKAKNTNNIFTPLDSDEDGFRSIEVSSAQMEQLSANNPTISWPPVRSGNVRGRLAMYISVDRNGHVREAWPLNSDNAGLEDPTRAQLKQWTFKPAVDQTGQRVQIDGGLGFAFETKIGDPFATTHRF